MVTIIEGIGIGTGISGLLIAIYSIIQQRKLETRLKEKEKLKLLAKRLDKVINEMSWFSEIKDPTIDEFYQLQMVSQRIISEAFDKKKDIISISIKTQISIEELTKTPEGKEGKETKFIFVEKKEDVIKYLEEGKLSSVLIVCDLGEIVENEILSYTISYFLFAIPCFFSELRTLEKEFGDKLEEFSPNSLKNLKDCIKAILMVVMYSKEIEINIK
ncbi:MAG: hypothetical protein OIN88_15505, partial [Candidatus Methanoperedens sp.]|nr:hypothetical protein [Candidatus Methanoperedens sp.]